MFDWTHKSRSGIGGHSPRPTRVINGAAVLSEQGLMGGTHVATDLGWMRADAIQPGQVVRTFGQGMRQVADVCQEYLWVNATDIPAHMHPVIVPAEALGNRHVLNLVPDQGVILDRKPILGHLKVFPAHSLIGYRGIHRDATATQITTFRLIFDQPQVLLVEGGTSGAATCASSETLLTGNTIHTQQARTEARRTGPGSRPIHRNVVARWRQTTLDAPAAVA